MLTGMGEGSIVGLNKYLPHLRLFCECGNIDRDPIRPVLQKIIHSVHNDDQPFVGLFDSTKVPMPSHMYADAIHIRCPRIRIRKHDTVLRARYESIQAKQIPLKQDIPALHRPAASTRRETQ